MDVTVEHQIREKAYQLWLADGCREGRADQHWLIAEHELLANAFSSLQAPTAAGAPPKAKANRRTARKSAATKNAA
jgi:hypothetical protein